MGTKISIAENRIRCDIIIVLSGAGTALRCVVFWSDVELVLKVFYQTKIPYVFLRVRSTLVSIDFVGTF